MINLAVGRLVIWVKSCLTCYLSMGVLSILKLCDVKINDEHKFHMRFQTQFVYTTSIKVVMMALCGVLNLPCTLDVVWF